MNSDDAEDVGPATVTVTRESLIEKALATGEIVPRHEVARVLGLRHLVVCPRGGVYHIPDFNGNESFNFR